MRVYLTDGNNNIYGEREMTKAELADANASLATQVRSIMWTATRPEGGKDKQRGRGL